MSSQDVPRWTRSDLAERRAALREWESALSYLEVREREQADYDRQVARNKSMREARFPQRGEPYRPLSLTLPLTQLEMAIERVGITQAEWWETLEYRRGVEYDLGRGLPPRPHPRLERRRWREWTPS